MKSKLLILLIFGWFGLFAQSVPNTSTFSLQDVVNVVGGTSLSQAFTNADDAYFDPAYKGSKNNMLNFRNYTIPSGEPCDVAASYPGGSAYPTTTVVVLGSGIGTVTVTYDARLMPDYFIVVYGSLTPIHTYWHGSSDYNIGGSLRSDFKSSLTGKTDPTFGTTYPDFTHFTTDGYPSVNSSTGSLSFTKSTVSPTTATVYTYGPQSGTLWDFTMSCPH